MDQETQGFGHTNVAALLRDDPDLAQEIAAAVRDDSTLRLPADEVADDESTYVEKMISHLDSEIERLRRSALRNAAMGGVEKKARRQQPGPEVGVPYPGQIFRVDPLNPPYPAGQPEVPNSVGEWPNTLTDRAQLQVSTLGVVLERLCNIETKITGDTRGGRDREVVSGSLEDRGLAVDLSCALDLLSAIDARLTAIEEAV